jgi:hypothetical protein
MSTGERIAPPNASAGRGGVVSFAGPHARSSAQLASLSHRPHGPDVARCRTLLDFARALRTSTWDLVVVDCGPGNPRLADVVAIYRRSGTAAPLVVVSEPTPQRAPMLAGIEGWTVVGPGDADRLAELIARCCGAPGCQAGTPTPAAPQSAALAEHSVLDRPAFLQSLRHPLAAGSATGVLLLLTLDSPAEQWLLSAVVFAALDSAAAPPAAFGHLAPDLFGALVDPGPADPGQRVPGISDPGLAGERTSLAWARMGMTLLGVPSAVLAYSAGHAVVAFVAACAAAVLGMGLLAISVRRQRAMPGMVERGSVQLARWQVMLTTGCVLLLAVASIDLVLF